MKKQVNPFNDQVLAAGTVIEGIVVNAQYVSFSNTYDAVINLPGGPFFLTGFNTVEGAFAAADHCIKGKGHLLMDNGTKLIVADLPRKKPSYSIYLFILLMFAVFAGFFAAFWILQNRFQLPCFLSVLAAGAFYYEYRRLSS